MSSRVFEPKAGRRLHHWPEPPYRSRALDFHDPTRCLQRRRDVARFLTGFRPPFRLGCCGSGGALAVGTAVCSSSGLERMDSSLSSLGGTFWSMDIFSAIPPCRQGVSEDGQRARGRVVGGLSLPSGQLAGRAGAGYRRDSEGGIKRESERRQGRRSCFATVCAGQSGGGGRICRVPIIVVGDKGTVASGGR